MIMSFNLALTNQCLALTNHILALTNHSLAFTNHSLTNECIVQVGSVGRASPVVGEMEDSETEAVWSDGDLQLGAGAGAGV